MNFWSALREGDVDQARALALPIDPGRLQAVSDRYAITALELGKAEGEADEALVPTSLPGAAETAVVFQTRLVRVDEGWRVDAQHTLDELRRAVVASTFERAGEALSESGRELGEAIERGGAEAAEAVREAIEELDRALREEPVTPETDEPPSAGRRL